MVNKLKTYFAFVVLLLFSCKEKNIDTIASPFFGESEFGLQLTDPKQGDRLAVGTTLTITWSAKKRFGTMTIDVLNNTSVVRNIAGSIPDSGKYTWSIPTSFTQGSNYHIRVQGTVGDTKLSAASPAFTIYSPLITVVSPNGGETLSTGEADTIRWTGSPASSSVKIQLWDGNSFFSTITASTANDRSYAWNIPLTTPNSNSYQVRILSTSDTTDSDFSDGVFSITTPSLQILSPNGGESLMPGQSYTFLWSGGRNLTSLNLELWSGGSLVQTIVTQTSNDGEYVWTVPTSIANGSSYALKVLGSAVPSSFDLSDADFTISTRPVTLFVPNGADTFVPGKIYPIYWDGGTAGGSVRIDLYKAGILFQTIVSSTSSRPYAWSIPTTLTNAADYNVYVSQGTAGDISDSPFTIGPLSNPSTSAYEPNDAIFQAYGPLVTTKHYVAFIGTSTDVDYYYFDVSLVKHARIYLMVPSGLDYDLALLRSDGSSITTSTGSGNELIGSNLNPGRYFVKVYGYAGSASGVVPYDLIFVMY